MAHYKLPMLEETGYAVLDSYGEPVDPQEWMSLEYVDWKSGGDTRFAPLASAYGEIECNGFWHFDPPKADKDGVWIDSQVEKAPTLVKRAQESGANVGRCRIIELQPNTYADALYNSHQDDNNRLNPDGEGWVVRCFMNLTDDQDTYMILREDINDPSTEVRIKLMEDPGERLQAFCSITFDNSFVVRDLKIIEGSNGPFVAMPSRKLTDRCSHCSARASTLRPARRGISRDVTSKRSCSA